MFNIGGGSRISVTDLIKLLEEITGKKGRINYIEKQKGDVLDTLADTGKISGMGWKPKVKIEEGLREFVKWFREGV